MRKIIFVRTAPYSYRLPGRSLYQSLNNIGLQKAQPHVFPPDRKVARTARLLKKMLNPCLVSSSSFARSQETANLFSDHFSITPELNEILFSMHDFSRDDDLPEDRLDHRRINKIRYKFSLALADNKLRERRENIIRRMTDLKSLIDGLPKGQNMIFCSHGFIMKLYENFFRLNGRVDNFGKFVRLHDWNKAPFGFLGGFVISYGEKRTALSYFKNMDDLL